MTVFCAGQEGTGLEWVGALIDSQLGCDVWYFFIEELEHCILFVRLLFGKELIVEVKQYIHLFIWQ